MKLKRLLVLAGVMALFGMLWASPAAADGHLPSITMDPASVPAEVGDVTVTVTGANWDTSVGEELSAPFFITTCGGLGGDPTALLQGVTVVLTNCLTITSDVRAVEFDASGGFTTDITVTLSQSDVDAGALVVLAGWLSASASADPEDGHASFTVLGVGAMDEMSEEEPMDDMGEEESMDEMGDELADTGAESNVLVIAGAAILAAGMLVLATGRRVRTAVR